ncbi:MAG TPA: DUF58 domain-containing protein [Luteibaculaceae bacterium]|nr:DUF58 domain-containing protein [Luteibaculaceae bacterium]
MNRAINRTEIEQLGRLDLIAKQIVQGFITGLHKSPFHGFSVEFAEHRLYNPGEDTKHVDWRLYARSDKLFTKQYEEETNLRCRFLIDTSRSMYYPEATKERFSKLEFACYAVAAFSEMLKHQRDAFGMSYFSDQVYYHSELKSTGSHQHFLLGQLEKLLNDTDLRPTNLVGALHEIAEQANRRSLVIVFSDFIQLEMKADPLFDALQHLRHNRHEVILFNTLEVATEIELGFGNQPTEFIDLESQQRLKINPSQVKKAYQEMMGQWQSELQTRCGELGIDYHLADVREGFYKVLLSYMLKRQKMIR